MASLWAFSTTRDIVSSASFSRRAWGDIRKTHLMFHRGQNQPRASFSPTSSPHLSMNRGARATNCLTDQIYFTSFLVYILCILQIDPTFPSDSFQLDDTFSLKKLYSILFRFSLCSLSAASMLSLIYKIKRWLFGSFDILTKRTTVYCLFSLSSPHITELLLHLGFPLLKLLNFLHSILDHIKVTGLLLEQLLHLIDLKRVLFDLLKPII